MAKPKLDFDAYYSRPYHAVAAGHEHATPPSDWPRVVYVLGDGCRFEPNTKWSDYDLIMGPDVRFTLTPK